MPPIRVLLVDDSPVALMMLKRMLAAYSDVEVVGQASNGKEALTLIPEVRPNVVCTDLHMPVMDGLELTKQIMATSPLPILMISSTVQPETAKTYPVLEAGALDVFPKPKAGSAEELERRSRELVAKIRVLSGVHVFRRAPRLPAYETVAAPVQSQPRPEHLRADLAVVGASTGGPVVLRTIFGALPADYPIPVLCVQHISDGFLGGLVEWLGSNCKIKIRVAQSGLRPEAGTVYFPVEGTHLDIDRNGRMQASRMPPVGGHRPSVNVTMEAAARVHGKRALGVLLTGMGDDGAAGMAALAETGALTIAQDEASCVVFGMPKQAIERGAARCVMPPEEIVKTLLRVLRAS